MGRVRAGPCLHEVRAHDGARPVKTHLTVKEAARRVNRNKSTIERWIADDGLEVTVVKNAEGRVLRRYVKLDELLAMFRKKLTANPTRRVQHHDETPP